MVGKTSTPPAPTKEGGKTITPEEFRKAFTPAKPVEDPALVTDRGIPEAATPEWPRCGVCPGFRRFNPRGTVGECMPAMMFAPSPFLRSDMDTCSYTPEERERYKTGRTRSPHIIPQPPQ
jgi:hypothetical protein